MILFIFNLLLAIVWVAVTGSASFINLVFGFVLAAVALAIVRSSYGGVLYLGRARRILALLVLFICELAKSVWAVAVAVMSPRIDVKPGIFAFPLTVDRDFEITLLANLITLTPGTLSVDVSDDRKMLYVHALDCSDPEAIRRGIADGFEHRIMEAFR
ncbi:MULTISPECIES: Na+/H+ antiporter subunit E [unclassified Rhizobium]|uniref:Na+/H+ antiporter subunit E n=1 Tax=unclassified Rhizobium TaxID=2613769 RepID=UPI000DDEC576|nr:MULTISPECIES: Na+/H+ antiporter subunit E [unclassified Rhizobium]MBB3288061.1 multicomponent Na+:H+ antiporter subunit E [Rhizobium sp. BK252]MBB3403076.1 multicomponent Na+:H+ antiporter subunit E [Rhizobium sp. BK289]MBB3415653.1 multicomponent Na+:H+ antiporter subunit E [Rhizobium sp. BK284]MBB3483267.1 multicomponent Na+:H+ antiporter subunit E [Rhizobium sp. BK347]MDK4723870.1 Na+/H+ antiporter subunit E [Rhizobium sp. CNPSo 3968]